MFVLACTMQERAGDERFYLPAREAAAKFKNQVDRIANRVDDYAVNTHSCIVYEYPIVRRGTLLTDTLNGCIIQVKGGWI